MGVRAVLRDCRAGGGIYGGSAAAEARRKLAQPSPAATASAVGSRRWRLFRLIGGFVDAFPGLLGGVLEFFAHGLGAFDGGITYGLGGFLDLLPHLVRRLLSVVLGLLGVGRIAATRQQSQACQKCDDCPHDGFLPV